MNNPSQSRLLLALPCLLALWSAGVGIAGYKARDWQADSREKYAAILTSEGVTIAAQPLYTDALAARIFDKKDLITRGIMPLAIVIFNDNDYPIEVDTLSIELIRGDERYRTLAPEQAVNRVFGKTSSVRGGGSTRVADEDALRDFSAKFLSDEVIVPHGQTSGFLYFRIYNPKDLGDYLSTAAIYIPNIYRGDNGSRLIYFEFELKPAVDALKRK